MRVLLIAGLPFLLLACGQSSASLSLDAKRQSELNALEALFRHQFANNASSAQQSAAAYCLSLGEGDPPSELIARFEDNQPMVFPESRCTSDPVEGVRIENIEGYALIHYVTEIQCSADRCEAEGGYYEGGLSSSENSYLLERDLRGSWIVTVDEMNWIS